MRLTEKDRNLIYGCLVSIRADHPHGLRAIGDANAAFVFVRHGVSPAAADAAETVIGYLYSEGLWPDNSPIAVIDALVGMDFDAEPIGGGWPAIGQLDEHGLHQHPDLLFTAVNWNANRYGIEADATLEGGLSYYQDWRDGDELASLTRVSRVFDAKENRLLEAAEISSLTKKPVN